MKYLTKKILFQVLEKEFDIVQGKGIVVKEVVSEPIMK